MQHLKTYEKFKTGTFTISEEESSNMLFNLNHFNGDDLKILRATIFQTHPDEIVIVDPKKFERKSAHTTNYYTLLIDSSEKWKDYPKRRNSLICTTYSTHHDYGQEYRVIPLCDKSKWGLCPDYDIWNSFYKINRLFYDLPGLNNFLKMFFKEPENIEELNRSLKNMEKQLISGDYDKHKGSIFLNVINKMTEYIENGKTLREYLDDLLSPEDNDFRLLEYNELKNDFILKNNRFELWTDAKCMLVPTDFFEINTFLERTNEYYR